MAHIAVIHAGLMTTLQDAGRAGLAFYAIPAAGPLDPAAAKAANFLVGNAPQSTVLECNFVPPALRFERAAEIALTGADMRWQIDGAPTRCNRTVTVPAGALLSGQPATQGSRAYIAVAGCIHTERSFGATACYALASWGGNAGRPLRPGDRICWQAASVSWRIELSVPAAAPSCAVIEALSGPEFERLTPDSKRRMAAGAFCVTPESNRMGARLEGPLLSVREGLLDSVPVLPGIIQLLPSGQCIVVLQDGQTTGGYPRIAYLPSSSLGRFNQLRVHEPFALRVRDSSG